MRNIKIKVNDEGYVSAYEKFIGNQYEHEATRLLFELPESYKGDNLFQYVVFTLCDGTVKIRQMVDDVCILDRDITNVTGLLLMEVVIKNIENADDLTTGLVINSQAISGFIKPASYNPEKISGASIDSNIALYLDEFDALLMEIRKTDARLASLLDSDPSKYAEIIDARGGYTVLKNRLDAMLSSINNNSNNIKYNSREIESNYNKMVSNYSTLLTKINAVASGSPLVASSTTEMTNTDKVYVNTTDGNWYYHNGTGWVIGGVYQSSGIAELSITNDLISNNAIDILKLDDYLQSTKLVSYSDFLDLGELKEGFYRNYNNVPELVTANTEYGHYEYSLTKDKIYQFNGYNISQMCGILVVDENNNPIYDSNKVIGDIDQTSLIFRVNKENLTAYISVLKKIHDTTDQNYEKHWIRYNTPRLREVEKCINKYEKLIPKKLFDIEKAYINCLAYSVNNAPLIQLYDGVDLHVYEMVKGVHYNIDSFNWSGITGICIVNSDNKVIYQSSTSSIGNTYELVNHDFIAEENGFIIVSERLTYNSTVTIIDDMKNTDFNFRKWYAIGDSITEKNYRALKNYVDYCSEDLDINVVNLGVSGTGYKDGGSSNNTFITRLNQITSYNIDTDVITVMGSINDIEFVSGNLGELGDTTTDTIYGSVYTFFNTLFTKFNGVRVGVILPINWKNSNTDNRLVLYRKALIETCEYFNIPYLDITNKTNLRPNDDNFLNEYYLSDNGDNPVVDTGGVHPNSKGHKLIYSRIKEFVKTL